jgi:type II secretory pathway pseudopilin PulG
MRIPPRGHHGHPPSPAAFSLIEVVMALGILAFAITALLGIFAIALNSNKDSIQELQATHIMQSMIAQRRAAPILDDPNLKMLLPELHNGGTEKDNFSAPVPLNESGEQENNKSKAKFALVYRIIPNLTARNTAVYCAVYWPGQAKPENAAGRVEVVTNIALPAKLPSTP